MQVATASSTDARGERAVSEAFARLSATLGQPPDVLLLYASASYDPHEVLRALRTLAPAAQVHGGTSFEGVMTQAGLHRPGLALFGLVDAAGSYGVGCCLKGTNPQAAARSAVSAALKAARRPGELPALVWVTGAPGAEEAMLRGIQDVLGPEVPVAGGSAADDTLEGRWAQFANDEVYRDAIVTTVLFPSGTVSFAFQSGHEPSAHSGTVTRASGRTLEALDGQPAADVYNGWTGEALSPGERVGLRARRPLGRVAGQTGGVAYYELSLPAKVTAQKGLTLFTDIEVGQRVTLMSGSRESLVTRAPRVAQAALQHAGLTPAQVAGALIVYCAGCKLSVGPLMGEVVEGLKAALPDAPFLGLFPFGEQGCFIGGENRHGNMMISAVVFSQ